MAYNLGRKTARRDGLLRESGPTDEELAREEEREEEQASAEVIHIDEVRRILRDDHVGSGGFGLTYGGSHPVDELQASLERGMEV